MNNDISKGKDCKCPLDLSPTRGQRSFVCVGFGNNVAITLLYTYVAWGGTDGNAGLYRGNVESELWVSGRPLAQSKDLNL